MASAALKASTATSADAITMRTIFLNEDTVIRIAMVLRGVTLANARPVNTTMWNDEENAQVDRFNASLLTTQQQDQVRDRLASDENGRWAVNLFNLALRQGFEISLLSDGDTDAYIKMHAERV